MKQSQEGSHGRFEILSPFSHWEKGWGRGPSCAIVVFFCLGESATDCRLAQRINPKEQTVRASPSPCPLPEGEGDSLSLSQTSSRQVQEQIFQTRFGHVRVGD